MEQAIMNLLVNAIRYSQRMPQSVSMCPKVKRIQRL